MWLQIDNVVDTTSWKGSFAKLKTFSAENKTDNWPSRRSNRQLPVFEQPKPLVSVAEYIHGQFGGDLV